MRRWMLGVGAAFAFLLLASPLLFPIVLMEMEGRGPISERLKRRPFDPQVWADSAMRYSGVRQQMVHDLLRQHRLEGMRRAQVERLLGLPERPGPVHGPDKMVYYLGPERGFISIDSEMLVLALDERGVVRRLDFHTD
jgi:hypothetical protein